MATAWPPVYSYFSTDHGTTSTKKGLPNINVYDSGTSSSWLFDANILDKVGCLALSSPCMLCEGNLRSLSISDTFLIALLSWISIVTVGSEECRRVDT